MIRIGGRRLAYFFLYFVVFAYVAFFPSVKAICSPYLTRRFPKSGRFGLFYYRNYQVLTMSKILVDQAVLGIRGPSSIKADFKNQDDFHRIKALDSGFIILMSHVGCWQVAMAALSKLNRPVNLLMLQQNNEKDKHYYEHGNEKSNLKIINPDQFLGGTLDMLNVLKNDEILCIMGDRLFGNTAYSLDTTFMGDKTRLPFSAYKLASIAQKPVVILNSFKSGPNQYKLDLPAVIHVPPKRGKKGDKYRPYADTYVETLEQYVHDHPYQFFNFYDMWADPRPESGQAGDNDISSCEGAS